MAREISTAGPTSARPPPRRARICKTAGVERAATILVVDDSVPVLHLVRSILQGEGFEVRTAESGEQALDYANAHHLDLVVLDALMPGMTGFEACEELKRLPQHGSTPVLFLTGMTDLRTYQQALDVGGDDLLGKPIHRAGLLIRVRALLRLAELRRGRERQVEQLEEQARDLQRLERRRAELVDCLLHDLQSPMASLRQQVRRLRADQDPQAVLRAADELDYEAGVLDRIVTNLALTAPADGHPLDAERRILEVAPLVEDVCARVRAPLEGRGIVLDVDAVSGISVDGDAELLRAALENLLDHARRSCVSGDHVQVVVRRVGPTAVVVRVTDPGRAAEPGAPVDGADTGSLPRGRGLGLEYCRAVAEAHGGQLSLTTEEVGLQAVLLLPARA